MLRGGIDFFQASCGARLMTNLGYTYLTEEAVQRMRCMRYSNSALLSVVPVLRPYSITDSMRLPVVTRMASVQHCWTVIGRGQPSLGALQAVSRDARLPCGGNQNGNKSTRVRRLQYFIVGFSAQ